LPQAMRPSLDCMVTFAHNHSNCWSSQALLSRQKHDLSKMLGWTSRVVRPGSLKLPILLRRDRDPQQVSHRFLLSRQPTSFPLMLLVCT
jgi:hypothetical protein